MQSEERGRTGAQSRGGRSLRRGVRKCRRVQTMSKHTRVHVYTHYTRTHVCIHMYTVLIHTRMHAQVHLCTYLKTLQGKAMIYIQVETSIAQKPVESTCESRAPPTSLLSLPLLLEAKHAPASWPLPTPHSRWTSPLPGSLP